MTPDQVVQRLAADPRRVGLFLDFDGTLTPIVEDPTSSRLSDELSPVLADLAERLGALAIVSGRPAAFLAERAAVPHARLLGLYGLQQWVDGEVDARPEAAAWQPAVDAARRRISGAVGGLDGVLVEDKGLSVAVHWRNAPQHEAAVARAVADAADESGLAREPGKLVEELRPPVDWDKGAGVRAVAEELGLREVAYVGDDLGDLTAFRAVRALGGLAVAVDHGEETPDALRDAADLVLEGTDAVATWLEALRDALPGDVDRGR